MQRSSTHCAFVHTLAIAVFSATVFAAATRAQAGSSKALPLIGAGIVVLGVAAALSAEQQRKKAAAARARARSRARSRRSTPRRVRSTRAAPRTRVPSSLLSRQQIATAQTALTELGLYSNSIDGLNGPGTRSAVAEYQKESGYPVTGYLSRAQYASLISMDQAPPAPPATARAPVDGAERQTSQSFGSGDNTPVHPASAAPVTEGNVSQPSTIPPKDPVDLAAQGSKPNPGSSSSSAASQ